MITRLILTAAAAAGVAFAVPAVASAATGPLVQPLAVSAAEQQAVLDYWTPDRMDALTQPSSDHPADERSRRSALDRLERRRENRRPAVLYRPR
ncbi:hypothetical protein ACWEOE_41950 [Amycolatopsis sp. NPDC004368]